MRPPVTALSFDAAAAPLRPDRTTWRQRLAALPLVGAFARFLGVGVVGLAVDASLFTALDLAHVAPEWSRAASLAFATLVTWQLNRRHTFGASGRRPALELARYVVVTLGSQGTSYGVFLTLIAEVPALPRLFDLLVGAGLGAVLGFVGHKLFAFSPAPPRQGR